MSNILLIFLTLYRVHSQKFVFNLHIEIRDQFWLYHKSLFIKLTPKKKQKKQTSTTLRVISQHVLQACPWWGIGTPP
jgi:hypothetical protein